MSFYLINIAKSENDYSTGIPTIYGHFECDSVSDLPTQNQTTYKIGIGSTAHIIDTNAEYAITSGGVWYVRETGTDVYTKSEVDTLLSDKITLTQSITGNYGLGTLIPDTVTSLDGYLTPGIYYSGTAIAPALDAFRLEVKIISESATGAIQQTIYPLNPNGYYVTRVYYSNTWQRWNRVTPFGVVGTFIANGENILDRTRNIGRYYKSSDINTLTGLPTGFSSAFYMDVVNTVGSNRKHITLYPATASLSGIFYTILETSSGFGSWYKFEGVQV